MQKDLNYILEVTTTECFLCQAEFSLYEIQKMPMNICGICDKTNKLTELISQSSFVKKIIDIAEKYNLRVNGDLVVDVSTLIKELQE